MRSIEKSKSIGVILSLSKLIVLGILSSFFAIEAIIISPIPFVDIIIYVAVMCFCILSLLGTFNKKIQKEAYISFAMSFLVFIIMFFYYPPVMNQHKVDLCLDSGQGVWDYDRNECREDCWRWDKEHGCYKKE